MLVKTSESLAQLTAKQLASNQQLRSRFDALYKSNAYISTAEASQVTKEIEILEEQLQSLCFQEQNLETFLPKIRQAKLLEIAQAKAATEEALYFNRSVMSPARYLPNEIILTIIHHAISDDGFNPFDIRAVPWTLSRISSRWRAASISFPLLWSSIFIGAGHHPAFPPSERVLREWLHRSREAPLTLRFKFGDLRYYSSPEWEKMLEMLIGTCERWQDVGFLQVSGFEEWRRLQNIRDRLPSLRRLLLHGLEPRASDLFSNTPQLEDANVNPNHISFLPWSQLRRLSLTTDDFSTPDKLIDCQRILQLSLQLEELSVQQFYNPRAAPITPPQTLIFLPRLRVLLCPASILCALDTPALESLEILNHALSFDIPRLIIRSSCRLRDLAVSSALTMYGGSGAVIEIFRLSPSLSSLRFDTRYTLYMEQVIEALHFQLDGETLVPQLTNLRVIDDEFVNHGWVDMVASRMSLLPVRSLRVEGLFDDKVLATIQSQVSSLREEGVDITVQPSHQSYLWNT
ncbi:hypothetical protein C8J56DRAFT_929446, partial [Mycena floridula]